MKRKKITFTISEDIIQKLNEKVVINSINKSLLIENLIKKWLDDGK
ncbi:MAG: hypothetical protein ACK5OW_00965 [bacterium]|jgi:hypothetical protein